MVNRYLPTRFQYFPEHQLTTKTWPPLSITIAKQQGSQHFLNHLNQFIIGSTSSSDIHHYSKYTVRNKVLETWPVDASLIHKLMVINPTFARESMSVFMDLTSRHEVISEARVYPMLTSYHSGRIIPTHQKHAVPLLEKTIKNHGVAPQISKTTDWWLITVDIDSHKETKQWTPWTPWTPGSACFVWCTFSSSRPAGSDRVAAVRSAVLSLAWRAVARHTLR